MQELQKTEEPEIPATDDTTTAAGNFVSRALETLLEFPGLSLLKPIVGGFLPALAGNLMLALAAVAAPLLLGLLLLRTLFGGKRASSVVCHVHALKYLNGSADVIHILAQHVAPNSIVPG